MVSAAKAQYSEEILRKHNQHGQGHDQSMASPWQGHDMDHSLSAGMAGYNSVGVSLGLDGFDRAATHDLHGAPGEGLGLSLSASHRHGHLDANGHHNQFLSDEHEDYHHRQFHLENTNFGLAASSRFSQAREAAEVLKEYESRQLEIRATMRERKKEPRIFSARLRSEVNNFE